MFIRVCLIVLLTAGPLWSQVESGAAPAAEDPMATPSPVNVEGPSLAFAAEQEHTNYLRGGLSFSPAYDDGLRFFTGDVSYSVRPSVAIDESGARLHWSLFYSPGFRFYQKNISLNQSRLEHDLLAEFQYRLSPHVTLTLKDGLTKSSASYHFDPNPIGAETGILQSPNQSVISPFADTLFNNASGQVTYQFSENGMIGASGTETEQHYLNPSQLVGFADWSTRIATAFYTHRLSRKHYIGATYQFQQLLSYSQPSTETKTHGAFLFYTLYASPVLSLTLFGGGQHFEFTGLAIPTKLGWSPAGGATLGWRGRHTSVNLSFAHRITDGSGLRGAAFSDNADLSIRHQLSKNLTGALSGGYAINSLVDPLLPGSGGHTVSGSVFLQRTLGEHVSVNLGYARSHQSYSTIAISRVPNRNSAWVAFSYKFERPLGR